MSNSIRRLAESRSARIATLAVAGALGLSVVAAAPAYAADTAKPTMSGTVSFDPTAVDTTTGDASSTAGVSLADNSGVTSAVLTVTGPDGANDLPLDLVSGTAASGVWSAPLSLTYFDTPGRFAATALTATDAAGNTATFTSGLAGAVQMSRTADTVAPVLVANSATTTRIDTTSGPADVVVRVNATDDLAGVAGGRVVFTSPDGQDTVEGTLTGAPVQGTPTNGSWDVPVTFPARSAAGVWRLTDLSVADAQYNEQYFGEADDQFTPLAVRVTNTDDATPPALTTFTVGPAKRSLAYGRSGLVYANVGFSDATSGVASVQVTLQRPDGTPEDEDNEPVVLSQTDLKTGTSRDGTVLVPLYVDNFVAGTWKVASVVIDDAAGNTTTATTTQLPGTRTTFEVTATGADTQNPTSSGYVFSPATLDTRTAAQTGSVIIAAADPDAVASGIAGGTATLVSNSGAQTTTATFTADDLVTGDQTNGTFRAGFSLPRNAEDGPWIIGSLVLTDVAKHTATVTGFANASPLVVQGQGRAPATAPGVPAVGTATVTGTTASVPFTAPADNGGARISRYRVTSYLEGNPTGTLFAYTSPASVPDLQRGRSYTFTVAAENSAGVGAASAVSNVVTPAPIAPAAPTIGRAELTDQTTATVAWTAPVTDGGAAITGYRVTPYLNGAAQPAITVAGTATTAVVGNLARGRTYTFTVAATNSAGTGTASAASNSVSVAATVPAAPTAASGTVGANTITVRWSAPYDGGSPITAYSVVGTPAGACTTQTTSCTITGLTPGQAYSFAVTAKNAVGSGTTSDASPQVVASDVPPQQASALTISSLPTSIRYGVGLTVTGRLTASGAGAAGQNVQLQYRTTGAWYTAGATTSAGDGSVRFATMKPSQSVQLRLVSAATTAYTAATSEVRGVTVTRQITIGGKSGTAKRGSKVTLAGRAYPARAGDVMQLQSYSRGAWRTVAKQRVSGSGYRFSVKVPKRGKYSFRVVAAANANYATSVSAVKALRVR